MYVLLTILIVIAAVLLTLLVLVQNSKGGGLAAGFSSGNQVMGAPKTADFLEKASWTLAAIIIALSILAVGFNKSQNATTEEGSAITEQVQEAYEAEQAAQAVPEFETEEVAE
ncbi:MAG: preprotein translocase subunit SecG [Paludibacteraceae bacterium]|jgi:preprotein translocase subunit SecG|nr:preprotein translocase subunit SecG [Paludibacteraceae bacterium]